ncbi:hypothetical protein HMPREF9545_04762, partial [Escherichia coli MS 16-3]
KKKKKKKGAAPPPPPSPDLYTLIFRLTIYIAKTLSNLTVCFERIADIH